MRTTPTQTAEPAAARAATHPSAKEEEIHPASWRLAGSPGDTPDHFKFSMSTHI